MSGRWIGCIDTPWLVVTTGILGSLLCGYLWYSQRNSRKVSPRDRDKVASIHEQRIERIRQKAKKTAQIEVQKKETKSLADDLYSPPRYLPDPASNTPSRILRTRDTIELLDISFAFFLKFSIDNLCSDPNSYPS
jgi:hypothetical protein